MQFWEIKTSLNWHQQTRSARICTCFVNTELITIHCKEKKPAAPKNLLTIDYHRHFYYIKVLTFIKILGQRREKSRITLKNSKKQPHWELLLKKINNRRGVSWNIRCCSIKVICSRTWWTLVVSQKFSVLLNSPSKQAPKNMQKTRNHLFLCHPLLQNSTNFQKNFPLGPLWFSDIAKVKDFPVKRHISLQNITLHTWLFVKDCAKPPVFKII